MIGSNSLSLWSIAPLLIGSLAFFAITGGEILWPTNTDWLSAGDPAAHWLGWHFFRATPLLQWPMGAIPDYGMTIGSSVVFTDAVPLLAFAFKPFHSVLPENFQYMGLWILLCFNLQALFAWKLLSLITTDRWLLLFGCIFFTVAPAYLWRLQAHYALAAQWVVLAALYFYLSPRFCLARWLVLLFCVSLIHAYLLAMVLILLLADLVQRRWLRQLDWRRAIGYLFACSGLTAFTMWLAGYFMLKSGTGTAGFGLYRMNLLSLVDPNTMWSVAVSNQNEPPGGYEGFNFLGSGMLLLGLMALYLFIRPGRPAVATARWMPLLVVSCGLFVYALSNQVAYGDDELFSYPMPSIAAPLTATFRVSGRFFWPVYYLLYFAIFFSLFRRMKASAASLLCLAALAFQLIDSADVWRRFRATFTDQLEWQSPLSSPLWDDIGIHYEKLILVPPENRPDDLLPLGRFGARHQMAVNFGFFARFDPDALRQESERLASSVVNNRLGEDSGAVYVFPNDSPLWELAWSQAAAIDGAGILDGFRIIAPGLRNCRNCALEALDDIAIAQSSLTSHNEPGEYFLHGWSEPEPTGTWSVGNSAHLLLRPPQLYPGNYELLIEGRAFVNELHLSQNIEVLVNGEPLTRLRYDHPTGSEVRAVSIPEALIDTDQGSLIVTFQFPDAISPSTLGLSIDSRPLALWLESLELRHMD